MEHGARESVIEDDIALPVCTEAQHAQWCERRGHRIVLHRGRYWRAGPPGFYNAVHWLARMSADEASRPSRACWGFRSTLCEADAHHANAALPLHVLGDVADWDIGRLGSRNRSKVRKCLRELRIVALLSPGLLLQQGYEVARSAGLRTGFAAPGSRASYESSVRAWFEPRHGLVLAACVGERLAGYITGYAIGSTAYIEDVCLASEHLSANAGIGLFHEWMLASARADGVTEVVHSPHLRERSSLCDHKSSLGFEVVNVPARVWFPSILEKTLVHGWARRARSHAYYRLYGHD